MAEEKIFLDETLPVVTYTAAPFSVLGLFRSSRRIDRRRGVPHTANVRVLVTDKRIVVDKKTFILANVATVSEHDDEAEVAEFNKEHVTPPEIPIFLAGVAFLWFGLACAGDAIPRIWRHGFDDDIVYGIVGAIKTTVMLAAFAWVVGKFLVNLNKPLTPDYAVVIESAGTRDNALVCKDRKVVQRIVRAISDALVAR